MSIPRQSSIWDDSRNSSQVKLPAPDAFPKAVRALAGLRDTHPELVQWIVDGHPTLTEAEHLERFGVPYDRPRRGGRS